MAGALSPERACFGNEIKEIRNTPAFTDGIMDEIPKNKENINYAIKTKTFYSICSAE